MRKIIALFLALFCILPVLALPLFAAGTTGEKIYVRDLSQTTVDQDLIGSVYCTSEGKVTRIETKEDIAFSYPAASTGDPKVISFIEAGYVSSKGKSSPFELYVYIYTPQKSNHYPRSIDLCVNYDMTFIDDEGQSGDPNEWRAKSYGTYELELIYGQSSNGTVKKYRVKGLDTSTMANYRLGVRKYDISNVNCLCRDTKKVATFEVGQSYIITGSMYEENYQVEVNALDVIHIDDIRQTHFRYANQSNTNYMTQINSVYFSIKNEDFARWGDLFSITSSFWRERTTPMVVTHDGNLWNDLCSYIGKNVDYLQEQLDYSVYLCDYRAISGEHGYLEDYDYFWSYNKNDSDKKIDESKTGYDDVNVLWWLFYCAVDDLEDANVSTQDILDRFQMYCDQILPLLSEDETPRDHYIMEFQNLVMSYAAAKAETGFDYGFEELTIYAEDTQDVYLHGYKYSSAFHKWWDSVIGKNHDDVSLNGIQSIQTLDHAAILALSTADKSTISKQYLVAEDEVQDFVRFCQKADQANETPVVLHFANSNYFVSSPYGDGSRKIVAVYTHTSDDWGNVFNAREIRTNSCYIAKEDIFLDFRMIEMGFEKNGIYTIIPVNQQPMDIISGTESHPDQGTIGGGVGSSPSSGDSSPFSEWLVSVRKWVLIIAVFIVLILLVLLITFIKKFFTDNFVTRSIVGDYYDRKREQRQNEAERERAERDHRHAMELERQKQKALKEKPKKDKKK